MTTSLWDREQIKNEFPQCSTIGELISQIESLLSKRGEVVCEISLNGTLLTERQEALMACQPVSDSVNEISVRTSRPDSLILEAMNSGIELIPDLETASLFAAECFRSADRQKGQKAFADAIEGCQWLINTLIHLRGAASGVGVPIMAPDRWLEAERVMAKVVGEVSEAYSLGDLVLVADLLEYEVTTALLLWRDVLNNEQAKRS